MEALTLKIIFYYLLMPLLAVLFGIIVFLISRKNRLLNNKKFILYILASGLILALPGLSGLLDYSFMPYAYLFLQVFYFFIGWYNLLFIRTHLKELKEKSYGFEFLLCFTVMFLGAALFSLLFNLVNELQYGLWASTCTVPFIFTSLFGKAYRAYLNIPLEIYKIWSYTPGMLWDKNEFLDREHLMVIEIELYNDIHETNLLHVTAKTSENVAFGTWFYVFLDDYNKKSPLKPIQYSDPATPYGWIFYVKPSFFRRRNYIDPDLSFKENKINPGHVIISRRVQNESISTPAANE